ncbi:MAG: histidinol phosphate phosphatase HisJ family [Clostridia bacterium]|jgi:histidinol-phosphatase (PHP family)|nr:histidinol phosphate phosphatase HisJ family [Clostridia bacterium]
MYRADYHVHTHFSHDSNEPIELQIEEAIRQGFDEIAITDHFEKGPINGIIQPNMLMSGYLEAVKEMQERYKGRIKIKQGIEIGYEERWREEIFKFIEDCDLDFIICSTHKCENVDLFLNNFFDSRTQIQAYTKYFENVLNAVKTFPHFSVYGHIDYINRYGSFAHKILTVSDYKDLIYQILKELIESGRGIEINTSGIRYGVGHFNPQIEVLKMYLDMGGQIITIGSDSHYTQHIGYLWDEAALLIKNIGFNYYTTFEKGKPIFHHL